MRHPSRGCPRGLRASPPRAREARASPGPHEAGLVGPPDRGSAPPEGSNGADGRGPHQANLVGCPGPIPRQVERGVVIALMARPTAVTPPVLGPPEVLDRAAAMAVPRAGKAPLGLHHLRAVPGGLVTKLPAELGQRCGVQPLPQDPAVGVASRVVSRGISWRRMAAMCAWSRARRRSLRRQRFEPHWLRERDRERRRSRVRFRASGAGLGTRSITPSAVAMVANQRTPTSTPTVEAGSGWSGLGTPHEAGLGTPSGLVSGHPIGACSDGDPSWGTPAAAGARPGRPPPLAPQPASGWRPGCAPGPKDRPPIAGPGRRVRPPPPRPRAARGGPDARPRWWSRPPPAAGPGAADASRSTPSRSRSRSARRRAPPGPPRWGHAPPDDPGRGADPQRARERAVTPGRPPGSGDRPAEPDGRRARVEPAGGGDGVEALLACPLPRARRGEW